MPAATADGHAAVPVATPGDARGAGLEEGRGPAAGARPGGPAMAARVAAALAVETPSVVSVAGEVPDALHRALPDSVTLVAADGSGGPGGADGTDPATRASAPVPDTALLVLDGARDDGELQLRLGAACRRFPGRLLVWQRDPDPEGVPDDGPGRARAGGPVPVERFFAFGFRRVFAAREGGMRHALHEYRLADYKQPPDWLNARYWANPERFHADPDDVREPVVEDAPDS